MDIFIGQLLRSKFDAVDISKGIDPDDAKAEIKYPAGTIVKVSAINNQTVWLSFPDGENIAINAYEALQVYEKVSDHKTLTRTTKGVGTPPKALFAMMPENAKWEWNYGWSVVMSLEPLNKKTWICQECYTELPEPKTEGDLFECPQCRISRIPVNINTIIATQD